MLAKLLISPNLETRVGEINKILSDVGLSLNHPDLFYLDSDQKLGIEQTKKIREHLSFKPYQAKGRGVVLEDAGNLTPEAQNALLKTLEELSQQTLFILGASSDVNFLPTVLSRCEMVRLQKTPTSEVGFQEDIEKLLKSDMQTRFEYVEKLKDKQEFLESLVKYFHQDLSVNLRGCNVDFLKELLEAEKWASSNVNIRAILEYLMLKMP